MSCNYQRNPDEKIRELERRVLAGDLTLVPALARAYAWRDGEPRPQHFHDEVMAVLIAEPGYDDQTADWIAYDALDALERVMTKDFPEGFAEAMRAVKEYRESS